MLENNRPNLFSYATSELSQDAFICWLLEWASPDNKNINAGLSRCAYNFVDTIFQKQDKSMPNNINKVKIKKQENNIDILCIINDEYALLIEDKTDTKPHSNQLKRYIKTVEKQGFKRDKILPIYLKTEPQSDYTQISNNRYKKFLRNDFIKVLDTYKGNNSILLDYRNYLKSISKKLNSYKTLRINEWNWYSWMGFYLKLQKEIDKSKWDYVPNQSGGFLGLWCYSQTIDDCDQYLQLEQDKLCIKIYTTAKSTDKRRINRNKWHDKIIKKSKDYNIKLKKPDRFGNGATMTVCVYDGEYRQTNRDHIITVDKTVQLLKKIKSLLESFK